MNSPNRKRLSLPFSLRLVGIILILASSALTFALGCLTSVQLYSIYILFSAGISLFPKSVDQTTFTYKKKDLTFTSAGAVALIMASVYINPISFFKDYGCAMTTTLTVLVHGEKGPNDLILRNKGQVKILYMGEPKSEPITDNGQAFFQNIEIGSRITMDIDFSEPYKSTHPDSTFVIPENGALDLQIALNGLDIIKGVALYNDYPISDVSVRFDTIVTKTGPEGTFLIHVPKPLQQKQCTVWFTKKGYETISDIAYPQTGKEMVEHMRKH